MRPDPPHGRAAKPLPGHDVESAPVTGTRHHGSLEITLRERALAMGTWVVERVQGAIDLGDADPLLADPERGELALLEPETRRDGYERGWNVDPVPEDVTILQPSRVRASWRKST